ncbi:MAG TPA: hypothetical protein VGR29_08720 [Thermomicrobiales bacterium]|nr:hypothetical protein [Thermomicrobiales bacterium]
MKKWSVPAALVLVLIAAVFAYALPGSSSAAQNCDDWGNDTLDRIEIGRQLLYPRERQEESTGSLQGDAQALFDIAQEQANSNPPDEAFNLNGDLVEGFSAGANALSGSGAAEAQIALAKGIIYNADLRVAYLLDGC